MFGSGYRSADDDTIRIKRCVCHISSTVMVVSHDWAPFILVVAVALFMVPVFTYFFQKFPKICGQICGLDYGVRFRG